MRSFAGMKKILTVITLLLLLPLGSLHAERLSEVSAREFAHRFFQQHPTRSNRLGEITLTATLPSGFVFTASDAFVIVGGKNESPIALGYGDAQNGVSTTPQNLPPTLTALLNQELGATQSQTELFLQPGAPAGPLLTTVRHQEAPYNAACPYFTYEDGTVSESRCVVGCVATALEECLTYYQREIVLQDTLHGWETVHYAIPDVLPGTRIDTRLILDNYDTEAASPEALDAIARLNLYCGMAARMNWGISESGANVRRLVEPLKRAFGYGFVHYADSYKYAPQAWVSMIANEVREGRPVLYAGYTQFIEGHAFVIDGIDAEGFFHVNWGYGGAYDGYFRLDVLAFYEDAENKRDAQAAQGFFCNQEVLLLHPDKISVSLPDTLTRSGMEVVIDSMYALIPPQEGKFTPIALHLRNTSEQTLTTPFELFTNAPTDTLIFEQGDYVALTGITLAAGEARKIVVDARFTETGNRQLRISPDDSLVLKTIDVEVIPNVRHILKHTISAPTFPSAEEVQLQVTIRNSSVAEARAGILQRYFLDEGMTCRDYTGAYQQSHVLYLNPGEEHTDTIIFRNLKPATTYTFKVKYDWHDAGLITFTTPSTDGIHSPSQADERNDEWYTIDGRRLLSLPKKSGIYIRNGKKILLP